MFNNTITQHRVHFYNDIFKFELFMRTVFSFLSAPAGISLTTETPVTFWHTKFTGTALKKKVLNIKQGSIAEHILWTQKIIGPIPVNWN